MVIHIEFDIKITDSAGKVLHRFENRFDEDVSSNENQESKTVLKIDFSDFLAEYLSSSGFFLREKLMNECYTKKPKHYQYDFVADEDTGEDENLLNHLIDSELEYKIHIGSNKVLIGKIPLKIENEADSEVLEDGSEDMQSETKPFNRKKSSPADNLSVGKQLSKMEFEQKQATVSGPMDNSDHRGEAVIDTILNYTMMKAIEKYEDNIFQVWYEAPNDVEQLNPTIF